MQVGPLLFSSSSNSWYLMFFFVSNCLAVLYLLNYSRVFFSNAVRLLQLLLKWFNQDFLAQSCLHNKLNIHITKPGLSVNCIINRSPSVVGLAGYSRSILLTLLVMMILPVQWEVSSGRSHGLTQYLIWTESCWNAHSSGEANRFFFSVNCMFQQNLLTDRYIMARVHYNRSTMPQARCFILIRISFI